ncbi:MAG: Asp-tRNA(Asn)/Glu-tRNA(Gln) amidotransferase subunit GatB [Candidatus Nealsonbacteria bacterium]|nr:Asp-tRNA(Asn)/Glu-tRNA(Gln) amidotransferase subunit GatB [Candidatus Nealsonbacteria bacterium]
MAYKTTIGLEIHVELKTKSKMFCDSSNDPLERHPNVNICPICLGHPGVLPVINEEAVRKVIKTGLALGCQIQEHSKFDRKNYFYPDLPKGYQISQYDMPLCKNGYLGKIRIRRVHLEEDTGRLIHPKGADYSLVDFNRAGIPLMELVTEPDISSAKEARQFAEELQLILRYIGVSDADMEKGQMRVEVNISLGKNNKLGTKAEIKNLNSFKAVQDALDYEIARQSEILESGQKLVQETRGWDDIRGKTYSQRIKEEAQDYRYFPEPDLPPLHFTKEQIKKISAEIAELPQQRRERFKKEYGLGEKEVEVLVRDKDLGEYFEKAASELGDIKLIKLCVNYILTDLHGLLKRASITDENFRITPENFADFIRFIGNGKLSSKLAKEVLAEMFSSGAEPSHIIQERGLVQISDESELGKIVEEIISQNPNPVEDFKKGKENALQFLVGQAMAKTRGKANPEKVRQILLTKLK